MTGAAGAGAPADSVRVHIEGGVAWITLNRADRLNSFVGDMRDRLAAAVTESASDETVRLLVITGAGRAFCAGADVDVMAELLEREDAGTFSGFVEAGARVVRAIRSVRQPVVAAVNGVAVGAGASLACACDLRVASDAASIGFTFNRIGLHPDWGATYFLPRLVGAGRAAELIFSARVVPAEEARQLGLFERVIPSAEFQAQVAQLAADLAAKPPLALSLAKGSLHEPRETRALEDALRREAEAQMVCFGSRDVREGIAAFREKRPARFLGQ